MRVIPGCVPVCPVCLYLYMCLGVSVLSKVGGCDREKVRVEGSLGKEVGETTT